MSSHAVPSEQPPLATPASSPPSDPRRLSSGAYSVLVTDAGEGCSDLAALALTRWSGDPTLAGEGFFLYVQDEDSGGIWSAGLQPAAARPDRYLVRRSPDQVTIEREDAGLAVTTVIRLAPEGDAELRRYTVVNKGASPRHLLLTTYAELVLNTAVADAGHPAFSKLFVQTEFDAEREAIVAVRRQRSPEDATLVVVHALVARAPVARDVEFETDRMRFIGRGRSLHHPLAMERGARLGGTVGNVLDPVAALRRRVTLNGGESATLTALLGAGATRDAALRILDRYRDDSAISAPFADSASAVTSDSAPPHDPAPPAPRDRYRAAEWDAASPPDEWEAEPLRHDNGFGGFSADGAEYVIRLPSDADARGPRRPPLPWVNVIANEEIGFLVSESGAANTWSVNSRENRLTPWSNDPVCDPHGEALWVRDERAGEFWSPTPGPTPAAGAYEVRHGFGYTRFKHVSHGLEHDVVTFVARRDPVKVTRVRLTNRGAEPRALSLWSYSHLVLGSVPALARGHVVPEWDEATGAILASNDANGEFASRVAFVAAGGTAVDVHATADRAGFIGVGGRMSEPAALRLSERLEWRAEGGGDPCAAMQVLVEVAPRASAEVVFLLGEDDDAGAARDLVRRYRDPAAAGAALEEVRAHWREVLGGVRVETPSPAIDLMVNGWLAYQNLSCRMLGRTAFYQSGGAFGFRDQLQDAAALLHHDPAITRRQIVLHASHQFVEGDVLHWWHPPRSKGIRTRFSDDLLWLPYVTAWYVAATGDGTVLDEVAPFLTARPLDPGEDEAFLYPEDSGERADVYEHCCRVIDRSLTRGAHGLPLMGTGDWNDGMNRVGREGRGESVWLGFFLAAVIDGFLPIAHQRGDGAHVERWRAYRESLGAALDDGGWDGAWYRRAYYDDGTPLGSAQGDECRIDAIAQAWSVISRVAPPHRATQALDAMERHLVDEGAGIVRLLAPPFDRTPHDPGYIKGYLPGVRENGGQYTHGALWAVRALAEAGRTERAAPLLEMLSPVSHGDTEERVRVYQVEPYVIAADVYGVAPHVGRGGWTWYTGSAGWMERVALESVLGLHRQGGDRIALRPCIPSSWPGFTLHYRAPAGGMLEIIVTRSPRDTTVHFDGEPLPLHGGEIVIPLRADGARHRAEVALGGDALRPYGGGGGA